MKEFVNGMRWNKEKKPIILNSFEISCTQQNDLILVLWNLNKIIEESRKFVIFPYQLTIYLI